MNRRKCIIAGIIVGIIAVVAITVKQYISVNKDGTSISVIGGADGPTSIFLAGKLSEGEKAVAEYTSITMEEAKEIFK